MEILKLLIAIYCAIFFIGAIIYWGSFDVFNTEDYKGKISVIIAYRNEKNNLPKLVECLQKQDYQGEMEFIFVDDHSNDQGPQVLENSSDKRFVLLKNDIDKIGKKQALKIGVQNATGEILIFTDADCTMTEKWVRLLSKPFTNPNISMVLGPFIYKKADNLLGTFQYMEQLLLWGLSYLTGKYKMAVMCNGANMAVRKQIYLTHQESIRYDIATGDDVFLLQKISSIDANSVVFVESKLLQVQSDPETNFYKFIHQKLRWASKAGNFKNIHANIIGLVMMSYLGLMIYLIVTFNVKLVVIKTFFELMFIYIIKNKQDYHKSSILKSVYFYITCIISLNLYPFYAFTIGTLSKLKKYDWKGRKY
ncbi:MAG: glycosyltransferase [Cytophagales bacterium]